MKNIKYFFNCIEIKKNYYSLKNDILLLINVNCCTAKSRLYIFNCSYVLLLFITVNLENVRVKLIRYQKFRYFYFKNSYIFWFRLLIFNNFIMNDSTSLARTCGVEQIVKVLLIVQMPVKLLFFCEPKKCSC